VAEANQLLDAAIPSGANIERLGSARTVNDAALFEHPTWSPPVKPDTHVIDFSTAKNEQFVRVYAQGSDSGQVGSWVMRADDIAGLTREQIASKYSLPQPPDWVTDVTVPSGTRIQASVANNILLGKNAGGGGGVQFQILNVPESPAEFSQWFSNARKLR